MPRITRPDMAAYGVPTDDLEGTLPWAWAEQRLVETDNYWLVTVNAAGRPHSMPVWGVWMPARERFGFSCAPNARKARNLAANDQVVVTNDDSANCVSLEGRARLLEGEAKETMARAYGDKYGDTDRPVDEMVSFILDNACYEVIPERAFGLIETEDDFSRSATKWVWDRPEDG
jgi:hypothetical protein